MHCPSAGGKFDAGNLLLAALRCATVLLPRALLDAPSIGSSPETGPTVTSPKRSSTYNGRRIIDRGQPATFRAGRRVSLLRDPSLHHAPRCRLA